MHFRHPEKHQLPVPVKSAQITAMSELVIDGHRIGVLFSEAEIAARVKVIAAEIAARKPTNLLVVPVLKGSFIFAADLIRAMHHAGLSPEVDFMILSSYRKSTKSSAWKSVLTIT